MFGWNDIPKFLLAFFLVMPVISVVHEAGHVFFARLMGGKQIKVTIGSGKPVFSLGMLEVRRYYFWYGLCSFENLKRNEPYSNILIFLGGALFNGLTALLVMALVWAGVVESGVVTYQFTYFSLYYIFFALFPMPYPDGTYSDGRIILDLLRNGNRQDRIYRIKWNRRERQWYVLDHDHAFVQAYQYKLEALEKAREIARQNRPSRVMDSDESSEREISNFPRIPL